MDNNNNASNSLSQDIMATNKNSHPLEENFRHNNLETYAYSDNPILATQQRCPPSPGEYRMTLVERDLYFEEK